jgi:hypothetical protein
MSVADLIDKDLDKLDPTFRERVIELMRRMRADGHDAIVFEAKRSFARAEILERRGTGVAKSMHCYGLAVDIIDRFHRWDAKPAFWLALRDHAEALGLTSGKRFVSPRRPLGDQPHVQALPAKLDAWVRTASVAELARRVMDHLDASDPAVRDTVRESVRAKAIDKTPVVSPLPAVDAPHRDEGDKR